MLRKFKVPAHGSCSPVAGNVPTSGDNRVVSGAACTKSDGSLLEMHLDIQTGVNVYQDYVQIPLPSLSGGTVQQVCNSGLPVTILNVGAQSCKGESVN